MNLTELLEAKEAERNEEWEKNFLAEFPKSSFSLLYPDAKPGPDNWPYLWITTETQEQKAEKATDLIKWLGTRGIGLVLNPNKQMPDYVFTYGMLWYYKEFGVFEENDTNKNTLDKAKFETSNEKLSYGYPATSFIPDYVRAILKEFFLQQGVLKPRWILLTENQKDFDLCFSLESLKSPPEKEHQGILEAISWFLPGHIRLALVSEKGLAKFEAI